MKAVNRKTLLTCLGNMILMYLVVHAVINFLFMYIDELKKYTFLFDGLIIISSILIGGLLSLVAKKNVDEKSAGVYAAFSAILLVLTLVMSYVLIPTMSIFAPQFMTTCFLIPGVVIHLALLLLPKTVK